MSFCLFRSLISLNKILYFSVNVLYFFQMYLFFIYYFFDAVVSEIVFLTLISIYSLLGYRNTIDFCMFILYPASLWNLLVLINFLMDSLGFFIYKILSSVNWDNLPSSFLIYMSSFSFSCLIASSIMLDRSC